MQLQFAQGDATWHKLRKQALDDLYFFASVVMGYADLIPMRELPHRPLCAFLQQNTGTPALDEAQVQLILQPRELGKSVLARCRIIQILCKYPNRSILLCSETATLATAILASIKNEMLTNDLLRALFPEVIPADENDTTLWRADAINVKRSTARPDPSIFVAGVDKAITGFHPDEIFVDDMIGREAAENARIGDRTMVAALQGWIRTLVPLVNKQATPGWRIRFIGTRWFMADPYDYVEELWGRGEEPKGFAMLVKLPDESRHRVAVYRRGDLAVMRRPAMEYGRSIFPEKWTLEQLAQMRVADPVGFACWYMNEPVDAVTQVFKASWLAYYERPNFNTVRLIETNGKSSTYTVDRDLDILVVIDPGGFRKAGASSGGGAGRARPAIVVTGTTPTDRHLVLEAWSEDVSYDIAARQVIEFAYKYGARKIITEHAGQQIMFTHLLKQLARNDKLAVAFEEYKPGLKDKAQRILVLEPFFQHGQIVLHKKQMDLLNQIQQFPAGARVDLLDVLHIASHYWRNPNIGSQHNVEERRKKELDAYYARRGFM